MVNQALSTAGLCPIIPSSRRLAAFVAEGQYFAVNSEFLKIDCTAAQLHFRRDEKGLCKLGWFWVMANLQVRDFKFSSSFSWKTHWFRRLFRQPHLDLQKPMSKFRVKNRTPTHLKWGLSPPKLWLLRKVESTMMPNISQRIRRSLNILFKWHCTCR